MVTVRASLTSRPAAPGFTLVELLVVVAIIAVLASLLLPALAGGQLRARKIVCVSNLRQLGVALHGYANDNTGRIPYGPKAPPFTSPADFYPSTGAPTSLLSLRSGAPVGLGLMLAQELAAQPRVLFCPGTDQPVDAAAELAKVGTNQAQGSYYYRHAGTTDLFDTPATNAVPEHLLLGNLGLNRSGVPIQALAMDVQSLSPPELAEFNLRSRTHHRQQFVNVLYADGHVESRAKGEGRYGVDLRNYEELRLAFTRILTVFERADGEP